MKVEELAKMFSVTRGTIWRWKKQGILDKKLAEYQKQIEFTKKVVEQDSLQAILQKADKITEILENVVFMSQNVQNMLQQVLQVLQDVSNMSQSVAKKSRGIVSVSQNVSDMSQNVSDYSPTVEVAHALGIARRTLNDWILEGKMKSIKVKGKNFIPKQEAFKFIFRDVFNRSSSISEFKEALKKVIPLSIHLSDEEINNTLLELDKEGVLSLQKFEEKG